MSRGLSVVPGVKAISKINDGTREISLSLSCSNGFADQSSAISVHFPH